MRALVAGCIGVTLDGGYIPTLEPGLNFALRNRIHHMANFKRTYQPGLHWSGVNNTMSHNYISDGPHNCTAQTCPAESAEPCVEYLATHLSPPRAQAFLAAATKGPEPSTYSSSTRWTNAATNPRTL